jgi:hypothetical protein
MPDTPVCACQFVMHTSDEVRMTRLQCVAFLWSAHA